MHDLETKNSQSAMLQGCAFLPTLMWILPPLPPSIFFSLPSSHLSRVQWQEKKKERKEANLWAGREKATCCCWAVEHFTSYGTGITGEKKIGKSQEKIAADVPFCTQASPRFSLTISDLPTSITSEHLVMGCPN